MAKKKADQAVAEPQKTPTDIVNEVAEATKLPEDTGAAAKERKPAPGRGWTERYVQPVKYRRFNAKDQTGKTKIMFQFDLPPGQDKPPQEVLEVVQSHKKTEEGYPTGLHFEKDIVLGKVWKLPDTPAGRAVADSIDQALDGVAKKLEQSQSQGR